MAVPHGRGHQSTGMLNAKKNIGIKVNELAADGIENVDKISGMSQLTGLDAIVQKYEREIVDNSWSGLEEYVLKMNYEYPS